MDNQDCYNKIKLSIATQEDILNYFSKRMEDLKVDSKSMEITNISLLENIQALEKLELDILKQLEILQILEEVKKKE